VSVTEPSVAVNAEMTTQTGGRRLCAFAQVSDLSKDLGLVGYPSYSSYLPAYENGKDRVFRNVGI